jgi:hypothetical protein
MADNNCKHEQFEAMTRVARLTEEGSDKVTGFSADIRIHCSQCGTPFEFIGVPGGYHPGHPMVSFDGTELRAPIRPSNAPMEKIPGKIYN